MAQTPPPVETLTLTYEGTVDGIHVMDADITIDRDDRRYAFSAHAELTGWIAWLVPWESNVDTVGHVAADGTLQPQRHEQRTLAKGQLREVRMRYDEQGGFAERVTVPDAHEDERDQVPASLIGRAPDLMTGLLAGLKSLDEGGSCDKTIPVFDGRRRFDLSFAESPTTFTASGGKRWGSTADRCDVTIRPIAGFWRKRQLQYFTDEKTGAPQPIGVWVAPVGPAGVHLPVRIETRSNFGPVVIEVRSVRDAEGRELVPAG